MRAVGGGGGRHGVTHHVGKIDTAFLEHATLCNNTADTTATLRSVPGIPNERCALIEGLQPATDRLLQSQQILLYRLAIGLLWHKRS